MTERMVRDVSNAEVYAPEVHPSPQQRSRAFVTSHRVIVYTEGPNHEVVEFMSAAITGEVPEATRNTLQGQLTIETDQGKVYVTRGRGCGCHSALKALDVPIDWFGR